MVSRFVGLERGDGQFEGCWRLVVGVMAEELGLVIWACEEAWMCCVVGSRGGLEEVVLKMGYQRFVPVMVDCLVAAALPFAFGVSRLPRSRHDRSQHNIRMPKSQVSCFSSSPFSQAVAHISPLQSSFPSASLESQPHPSPSAA